jgi:hypothetical protein
MVVWEAIFELLRGHGWSVTEAIEPNKPTVSVAPTPLAIDPRRHIPLPLSCDDPSSAVVPSPKSRPYVTRMARAPEALGNMWRIHHLDLSAVTLDFSSAGAGLFRTSALIADGTVILNATDLAVLEDDGCVQVTVCPSCGTARCEPGGWVMPRRFGEAVVWLPAFARLADDDWEFRPPDFVHSLGVPYFDGATARRLGELVPRFRVEGLAPITPRDLALLTQWLAARRFTIAAARRGP